MELLKEEDELTQEDFNWNIQVKYHYIIHGPRALAPTAPVRRLPAQQQKEKEEAKRLKALGMPEPWNPSRAMKFEWLTSNQK